MDVNQKREVEWPTLAVAGATYGLWIVAVFGLGALSLSAAIPAAALAIAWHASLTHEVIHGHPFRSPRSNAALVWPALGLIFPFARFRDTHLAHHGDCSLTDPYDDPESNFLATRDWRACPCVVQRVLAANNTLLGRLLIGPIVGTAFFLRCELRSARRDPRVLRGWLMHLPPLAAVFVVVAASPMPLWAYLVAAYAGNALIRIRTFLEHRAHSVARGRSVIIEDRGPLALLFLNNNLHAVHHMHPSVPWYSLPELYRDKRERFLAANDGYRYASYAEVFRRHFLRAKDPVPHPLYPAD